MAPMKLSVVAAAVALALGGCAPAADPAPTHECCSSVDPGNGHDCGAGCACPPAAAAMVAVPPRDFAVAPQPVRPPGPARGDPGRAAAPGHRPPIA